MEQGEIEVLLELGQTYLLNKDYGKAIVKFSEALRINPHDPEIYYYLGLAYEGAEKFPEAVKTYEKTLTLDSNHSNAEIRLNEVNKKISEVKKDKK
jgi:Flp pilus assembly protein TadD